MKTRVAGKRGRPPKFGRRGQLVAITLPQDVVAGLRKVNADLAWAIVTLFKQAPVRRPSGRPVPDAELVSLAGKRSLIVVNRHLFKDLPGVNVIPLSADRAFLALEPGRGMADLELAVLDRLAAPAVKPREREALTSLRTELRRWRRDRALQCRTRAIIVVEHGGAPAA